MSATNLTNIIITQPNGNRLPMQNRRTATGVVSAKQNWALNAEDTVEITVESPFSQTYNIGDLYYNTTSGMVWRYVKIQWRPKPGFVFDTS